MADSAIYAGQSLTIETVSQPFVDGTLAVGGDLAEDTTQSANRLQPDLVTVVGKSPFIRATLLDPSALTAAAAATSAVVAVFRAYEQNGGPGATYRSYTGAQGMLIPVRLNFAARSRATLDFLFRATFSAGTAIAVGTTNTASAAVAKSFYPTDIVIGSDTITDIQSGSVSWEYAMKDLGNLEPAFVYYDRYTRSGEIVTKDLAMVTAARLEDGATQSVTLTLTNRESGGGTITVTLGNCYVKAEISGNEARISFREIGN